MKDTLTFALRHVIVTRPTMEERLRAHSAQFLAMVALIPAQYYAAKEGKDETKDKQPSKKGTRFWRNKKTVHQLKHSKKAIPQCRQAELKEEDTEIRENGHTSTMAGTRKQFIVESVKSTSLSELQDKLHRKIEEVAMKRSTGNTSTEAKKRKRRRRETEGGPTRKQQRLEEKQKHRSSVKKEQEAKQKRATMEVVKAGRGSSDIAKTGINKSQFSFNQFEFNLSSNKEGRRKNYQALIAKAEAKQKQLEELTRQDQEKGTVAQEKEKWTKAVRMARGEKLKDDPTLLRKTMKRLEKKKQIQRKKWGERMKKESLRKDEKQKRRQQNIHERIEKIKAKNTRKWTKKKGML